MPDGLGQLIDRLDAAVQLGDAAAITHRVKQELEDAIQARTVLLPSGFTGSGRWLRAPSAPQERSARV
jgi:hypothetical protein